MAQSVNINAFRGLFLSPNSFNGEMVPPGGFEVAQNVVIKSDGIISKRRGFSLLTASAVTPRSLVEYNSELLLLHNSVLAQLNTSTGALTSISGAVTLSSSYTPRTAQLNGNLYITGSSKIYKCESTSLPILNSGIPPGLDLTVTLSDNSGILTPNYVTGYRALFGRKDASGNKVVGAPSELTTVSNPYVSATYSSSGTTVTVTKTSHGYANLDTVVVANATDDKCNGSWTITYINANSFSYTCLVAPTTTTGSLSMGVFKKPTVELTIPSGLSTEHFYTLYRCSEVTSAVGSVVEDHKQIYEANLSSAQISAGKITFVDTVAELFKGAYLYTNPNQEGIASKNYEPPIGQDLCAFKNCLFIANIEGKSSKAFNLVSTVAGDFASGNYITVTQSAVTKRYVATTTAPTPGATGTINSTNWDYGTVDTNGYSYFYLQSPSGSLGVSASIENSAKSLCKAINRHSTASVYAYYSSGASDAPGGFRLVSKATGLSFTISGVQAAAANNPFLPNLNAVTVTSEDDDKQATIAFSKLQEPEAFPLGNRLPVGAQSSPIQRIIPLQDAIIVLKRDDGVWKITGDSPSNFSVSQIDGTLKCVASDSVVTLNNQVIMLSNQGVASISEQGASVVSRPIENVIQPILGSAYVNIESTGLAYESERCYYLCTITPSATTANVVYVYNLTTNAWTTSDELFYAGQVFFADDKAYLISINNEVIKERKSYDKLDYCGRSFAATIHSVPSTTTAQINITTNPTISIGDCFVKAGSTTINRVLSVDTTTSPYPTVTFANIHGLSAADTGTYYNSITSVVKTVPQFAGDINKWKQWQEFKVTLRNNSCSKLLMRFYNDNGIASDSTTWLSQNSSSQGWGYNWGNSWGGGHSTASESTTGSAEQIRTLIPLAQHRGTYLQAQIEHSSAGEELVIQGFGFQVKTTPSVKTTR